MTTATPPLNITLDDVEAAAERIKDRVRRTPCLRTQFIRNPIHPNLMLKMESLQVTGSFKARGANNAVLSLDDDVLGRGIVTASGGNHGTAVAYAGHTSGVKTVVYLPERASAAKICTLKNWGAEVVLTGDVWDEANADLPSFASCTRGPQNLKCCFIYTHNETHVSTLTYVCRQA